MVDLPVIRGRPWSTFEPGMSIEVQLLSLDYDNTDTSAREKTAGKIRRNFGISNLL